MIRILVVDDHALVRRGLIEILEGLPDGVQFGEAGTAAEGLALALGERWDVVLLDLGLPDSTGSTSCASCTRRGHRCRSSF